MKGLVALKKTAVIAAVCMAVVCLPGYSEPTPEQVKERTDMLIKAIETNDVERAKLCIKLGADVNAKVTNESSTRPLLIYAIDKKNKEIAELLILAGADVNAIDDNGYSVIMYAITSEDIMELLINLGADVNATDSEGISALDYAILYGKNDIAELLKAAMAKE